MAGTVADWLKGVKDSNTCTITDEAKMMGLLRKLNFPKAVVTCGTVYFEGKGTPEAPPVSIHQAARLILKQVGMA